MQTWKSLPKICEINLKEIDIEVAKDPGIFHLKRQLFTYVKYPSLMCSRIHLQFQTQSGMNMGISALLPGNLNLKFKLRKCIYFYFFWIERICYECLLTNTFLYSSLNAENLFYKTHNMYMLYIHTCNMHIHIYNIFI